MQAQEKLWMGGKVANIMHVSGSPLMGSAGIKTARNPLNSNYSVHTHPSNDPFSGTTQVSWYQKDKTKLDFTEARDSEWLCHQMGHMQVCISLQTDNHESTTQVFLQAGCPSCCQPTASKHWRQEYVSSKISFIQNSPVLTGGCSV